MLSCAPIANPPNSGQLGGTPYHSPSCIRVRAVVWAKDIPPIIFGVGMRSRTDRKTDTHTHTDERD